MITADQLRRLAGTPDTRLTERLAPALDMLLPLWQINTPLRVSHFLAQACIETDYWRTLTEYASGAAYDTRTDLGNTAAVDGDGPRYKGRGIFQLTGTANYRTMENRLLTPLIASPELAAEPALSVIIASIYWDNLGLNRDADADSGARVSRGVNRGNPNAGQPANAEADRIALAVRAKGIWGATTAVAMVATFMDVQTALVQLGYGPLTVDGTNSSATDAAVRAFQKAKGLFVDGVAGPLTRAAMTAAIQSTTGPA